MGKTKYTKEVAKKVLYKKDRNGKPIKVETKVSRPSFKRTKPKPSSKGKKKSSIKPKLKNTATRVKKIAIASKKPKAVSSTKKKATSTTSIKLTKNISNIQVNHYHYCY